MEYADKKTRLVEGKSRFNAFKRSDQRPGELDQDQVNAVEEVWCSLHVPPPSPPWKTTSLATTLEHNQEDGAT